MSITEAVSVRLEGILKERGMKKTEFKELPGVKAQSVSNIFRTKSMPSITMTTLHRISRALDMTMAEFMDDPIFDNITIDDQFYLSATIKMNQKVLSHMRQHLFCKTDLLFFTIIIVKYFKSLLCALWVFEFTLWGQIHLHCV